MIAREDHDNKRNRYAIWDYRGKRANMFFEDDDADLRPFNLLGTKSDGSAMVVSGANEQGYRSLYELDFEGNYSDEIYIKDGADVDRVHRQQAAGLHGLHRQARGRPRDSRAGRTVV